jgi:hypothetical protein
MATGITLILKEIKPQPMIMESKYYEAGCYKQPRVGQRTYRATRRIEDRIRQRVLKKARKAKDTFTINTEA